MSQVEHHLSGRDYWLSLEHLASDPALQERVAQEFAGYSPEEISAMPRRKFLQLMGASMALAGLTVTGCRRWPVEKVVPFAHRDPDRIPGVTQRYATMMEMAGVATGLLVSSYDGRPIKVEGNPLHPYSLGATDAFAQASVLELYDPDRSRQVLHRAGDGYKPVSWADFERVAEEHFKALSERQGQGLSVLTEATTSPTVAELRRRLAERFPRMGWFEYEPISRDQAIEGSRLAFGRALRPVYHLDQCATIVSFDADLLGDHPAKLRHARDWAAGRAPEQGRMSRMFVVESVFSNTGGVADHRFPTRPAAVERMLAALAVELGAARVAPVSGLTAEETQFVAVMAADLRSSGRTGLVAAGERLSPEAQAIAHRINEKLGSIGGPVSFVEEPDAGRTGHIKAIETLAAAMRAGEIDTLVMLGGNPAYDAPADLEFGKALGGVAHAIHLSYYPNETSRLCAWQLPRTHYLECWHDGRAWDGTVTLGQPLILPIFEGRSPAELLALMNGDETRESFDLVRRTFQGFLPGIGFDAAWQHVVHDGLVPDSGWKTVVPQAADTTLVVGSGDGGSSAGMDLVFTASPSVFDGRFANNGWLQEMPSPLTKVTWDNPALISKGDADRLGVKTGDVVRVSAQGRSLELAACVMPGQPRGVVHLTLGYGREYAGNVGNGVGFNTYALRSSAAPYMVRSAEVVPTGGTYPLAITQDHFPLDAVGAAAYVKRVGKRDQSGELVREASLAEYRREPNFVHRDVHGNINLQLYEPPAAFNEPHAWGMAIDMSRCIGCSACVVACQAENNVPIVGKEEVRNSREMHWLRIDRYFKGEPDENAEVVHQPMMCVHCENAPCEQVCPVAATVHDSEGLNTMVYNRCIGTRYCSNNCPYKVRRFNYFDWHSKDPRGEAVPWLGIPDAEQKARVNQVKQMVFNPDVTVRMRGVMEKCTYCTQRIAAAKIGRRTKGEEIQDGDVVTACQQACPTQAIVFGNLNDPDSEVARRQKSNRAYGVLATLNTRPRTQYLARISNPVEGATA